MSITENPTIDLTERDVVVLYMTGGCAIFGCTGDPEGVIFANNPSLALSTNGNVYFKTTNNAATGWTLVGGGGGTGTVTNFTAGNLSPLFNASVASPTTTPALTFAQIAQSANEIFAGPSTGAAANPTFRRLVLADLALAAAPPANGIQYNDGTNAFTASNGFKVDPATNTLQVGELNVLKGTLQLQAGSGGGSYKITTSVPTTNHVWLLPDAAPVVDQLLKITNVSGANYTLGYISPSGLGFPSINATDGVIPYRSSSSAFSDSPITRLGANSISIGNSGAFAGLQITGNAAGSGLAMTVLSSGTNEDLLINGKGTGKVVSTKNGSIAIGTLVGGTYLGIGRNASVSGLNINGSGVDSDSAAQLNLNGTALLIDTAIQVAWSNTSITQVAVVGFAKLASGVVRVSNGSTGAGQFVVGSSTASTSYQFLSDSQSTTRTAGAFTMPNGSSVPTIQGITNSIQSFAFNPSGKIQGGMNIPTTNQQTAMIGNAKSDVSTIGNVGVGEDNLLSFVIQANVLANNGDYFECDAFGEFAANANNKTLKCKFGTATIFNTGAVAFNTANWRLNVKILRTGSSAQKCIATFWSNDATTPFLQEINTTAISLASNQTVQFTGEATANDDITQLHMESKLVVAQTS